MKIITQIEPTATDGQLREPRGILQVVHVEPRPGCHLKVQLGSAGLFIRRGDLVVVYPLEVLLRAADSVLPDLSQPTTPPAPIANSEHRA